MPTRVRVRHHVNPLKLDHLGRTAQPLALPLRSPIEVELGCAEGQWLFERQRLEPRGLWIGLEIREPLVDEINRQARAQALAQSVRAHHANITTDLEVLFADGTIDRFVINFPDPWFKRRHKKRRLVTRELGELLSRKLKTGGEVFFQSDVWDLALDAMTTLEQVESLANVLGPWSFVRRSPFPVQSRREARCIRRGDTVWRLLYRKVAGITPLRAAALRAP